MKFYNKRGDGTSVFVWIAVFFAGTFILFGYLFAVGFLVQKKNMFEGSKFSIIKDSKQDYSLSVSFFSFLNKGVNFNGETIKVKELVFGENDDPEKLSLFKNFSEEFLDKNIFKDFSLKSERGNYKSAFIRIYPIYSDINSNDFLKYSLYSPNRNGFNSNCNLNSIYSNVVISIAPPNKKIVFCVEYNE